MNTSKMNLTTLVLALSSFIALSSCGTQKSNSANPTTATSSSSAYKSLASCYKNVSNDISLNISAVSENSSINPNWIKIKFNFLSSQVTKSGNFIKFYKWKALGSQYYVDNTPLSATAYNLTTKNSVGSATNSISTTSITTTNGYSIELNDPSAAYQVLKAVVYTSSGAVVAQIDTLIPQFYASYSDYGYNKDGSVRPESLKGLHPLKNTDTSAWTAETYTNYYNSFCF
ncbi:MAG: hypothetical protein ACK41T_05945 [Pseudobdellovibrio sp.]